jgi:hypothetical protein
MNIFIIKLIAVSEEGMVTFVSVGTLFSKVTIFTKVTNVIFPDITSPHPFWLQRIVKYHKISISNYDTD